MTPAETPAADDYSFIAKRRQELAFERQETCRRCLGLGWAEYLDDDAGILPYWDVCMMCRNPKDLPRPG